jgi:hypothetical protein
MPGGKPAGGAGMDGIACIAGKFVGPRPGGTFCGRIGMGCEIGIALCGPIPGGSPAGMAGKPGGLADESSPAFLSRTKVPLCGKTSVTCPELRSTRLKALGQLVSVISTRRQLVPTV